ncbi:S9 family peptidase [Candidatus Fermentibacterales bacterium]|nr:S9 family peptidase [Candidatus Fermentibacterales bacterium]
MPLILSLLVVLVSKGAWSYPPAPVCDQVDEIFGVRVADPYRWLEDVDSDETLEWVAAQNALWRGFVEAIPVLEPIRDRLEVLQDFQRYSMPHREGDLYFFYVNEGLQEHYLYCCRETLDAEPRVLIDPNGFPRERALALAGTSVTDDGSLLAWATSESGSDWTTWYVMDVETRADLGDTIRWSKGWVAWNGDNTGLYYSRYDEPEPGQEYIELNELERVFFHRLGTDQSLDSLVYERPDRPEWMVGASESEDHRYLLIWVWDSSQVHRSGLFYVDLESEERQVVELLCDFDAFYSCVGNAGEVFYFVTDMDAPHNRIISIDIAHPERESWLEIVPESDRVLESASLLNGSRSMVLQYTWEGYSTVELLDLETGARRELGLPGRGSVWGFGGRQEDTETFYTFTSFLHPGEIYRYDFGTGESTMLWAPDIDADLSVYEEKQVFYESFDGTMVPMFLVYPRGMQLDGSNPAILTGYGGFRVSMGPWFSTSMLVWMEMGGVYAIPCIRGGGEYGEEWHLAGIRENRPVVYRDFIAAAEYLIDEGYTSAPRLAISGGSNGGTLVAACLNMRPDLFGAACPAMGVMDLLRFHLFTVGRAWVSEYGDADDPDEFRALLGYSPYHNIADGIEYPPVLVTTADHDDRVVPGHSFKYAARLQAAQAGDAPILIAVHPRAGHGGAVGLSASLDRTAERFAFLWEVLEMGEEREDPDA